MNSTVVNNYLKWNWKCANVDVQVIVFQVVVSTKC